METVIAVPESEELRLEAEKNQRNEQQYAVSPLKLNYDASSDNEENINDEDGNSDSGAVLMRQNWSFYNPQGHRNDDAAVAAPKAYDYKDLYQNKREMALRQREEEERKAREFRSRPVPNFKALHKRLKDVVVVHRITVPLTPETLKHSLVSSARKKRREQVSKNKVREYVSNPTTQKQESEQLQADAKGCRKPLVEVKPFQLRTDQRVRERREYNESVQNHLVQKKKEVNSVYLLILFGAICQCYIRAVFTPLCKIYIDNIGSQLR